MASSWCGGATAWWLTRIHRSGVRAPLGSPCIVLEQDMFTPITQVMPRKRWLHPNMTDKLFTGTLSIKQTKISWKELPTRLTICFLVMSICNFCCFQFWSLRLITQAPAHWLPFTFQQNEFIDNKIATCLQRCENIII